MPTRCSALVLLLLCGCDETWEETGILRVPARSECSSPHSAGKELKGDRCRCCTPAKVVRVLGLRDRQEGAPDASDPELRMDTCVYDVKLRATQHLDACFVMCNCI